MIKVCFSNAVSSQFTAINKGYDTADLILDGIAKIKLSSNS